MNKPLKSKDVFISINSFRFCRYTMSILVWLCFFLRLNELMAVVFFLFIASAILTVKNAPLIRFYDMISKYLKFLKGKETVLQTDSIRFAHILGAVFSGICLVLLYTRVSFAWNFILVFAILKSISAVGFCPGEKIYRCINSNNCCKLTRLKK